MRLIDEGRFQAFGIDRVTISELIAMLKGPPSEWTVYATKNESLVIYEHGFEGKKGQRYGYLKWDPPDWWGSHIKIMHVRKDD